jgi:hypothetical protein
MAVKSKQNRLTIVGDVYTEKEFREAYRKVELHDDRLTFAEHALEMTILFGAKGERHPISKIVLFDWFKKREGELHSETTRPYLTPENVTRRIEYANTIKVAAGAGHERELHLDEKWFYINNRRNVRKVLPRQKGEGEYLMNEDDQVCRVGELVKTPCKSRRYITKVMVIGIVGRPTENNNGMLMLQRVATMEPASRDSNSKHLVDDVRLNKDIQKDWKNLVTSEMTGDEMVAAVKDKWDVLRDVNVVVVGCFGDVPHQVGKRFKLEGNQLLNVRTVGRRPTSLPAKHGATEADVDRLYASLKLERLAHVKDELYEKDCNCDGEWLKNFLLKEAAPVIVQKYGLHWPFINSRRVKIQMDNAGGHGGATKIEEIRVALAALGIDLVCQPANSPEFNVLDLGVWRGLQALVNKLMRDVRDDADVLWANVQKAWTQWGDTKKDSHVKIWKRLEVNAENCLEAKGGNRCIEAKKGYKIELPEKVLAANEVVLADDGVDDDVEEMLL